jgi:hypothetical protein
MGYIGPPLTLIAPVPESGAPVAGSTLTIASSGSAGSPAERQILATLRAALVQWVLAGAAAVAAAPRPRESRSVE